MTVGEQEALFDLEVLSPVEEWLGESFPEVGWREFYRELFPEGEFEEKGVQVPGRYNGIAVQVVRENGREKAKRFTVTDDLDVIGELVKGDQFCVMSPVSYAGKTQRQDMARFLYAIAIDLDGIKMANGRPVGLDAMWYQMTDIRQTVAASTALPQPTYVVFSGRGIHLYYLLERPVPLFRNVLKQLSRMRYALVKDIWNQYITDLSKNKQFESVTQSFRMVGSITKDGGRVKAYRTGERVSIEYLNAHIRDETCRLKEFSYKSDLSLTDAKKKYPQWYQRRVVEGKPRGTWTVNRALYEWWKKRILNEAREGHRYFCVMALAIYGRKCGVERDEVERDALALVPYLDRVGSPNNPFTVEDAMKAIEAHDARYQTFPRRHIEALTAISIPPNKRNGRTRAQSLEIARAVRDIDRAYKGKGPWWENGGRPKGSLNKRYPKRDAILAYAESHPGASQRQIAEALGVSKTTVNKWMTQSRR